MSEYNDCFERELGYSAIIKKIELQRVLFSELEYFNVILLLNLCYNVIFLLYY